MLHQQSFLNETGYNAYVKYSAIKRHFTSSYDYHKYNGKINTSFDAFVARRDAYSFQRLGKHRDYEGVILSNIVENPKVWIGSLLDDCANDIYFSWKKKQDSITQHIKESLNVLDDDFRNNFISTKGQYPLIVEKYLQKNISLETLTILAKLSNSEVYWKETVTDTVVFPDILRKISKYHPFLVYSNDKIKKVIKDHFF